MKGALEGLPGVSEVSFDPRTDTFRLEGSEVPGEERIRDAALEQVLFPRLRRALGGLKGAR